MNLDLALDRMPHRGAMQLIAEVLDADPDTIRCLSKPHQDANYPLRVDGRLHNMALVELGAQAAAAHASLYGVGAAHVGLLLTLSGVEIGDTDANQVIEQLQVRAIRLAGDERSARYRFRVEVPSSGASIVWGDAVLSMRASA